VLIRGYGSWFFQITFCRFRSIRWVYLYRPTRLASFGQWLVFSEPPLLYGSWIYNYLCNQCLSPRVRISIRVRCTTLCDKVCQWLATGRWFSPGPSVSATNKTDCHDITEISLKVALNIIKQTNKPISFMGVVVVVIMW
jgi:hypothetical protein